MHPRFHTPTPSSGLRRDPAPASTPLETIQNLVVFGRLVEAGSFTAAAVIVGLSKSVVSQRITDLERALGVTLLVRSTRKLVLTPEGADVYERCREWMVQADRTLEAASSLSGRICGVLRLSVPSGFGSVHFSRVVPEFVAKHPEVHVEMTTAEASPSANVGAWDLAVRFATRLDDSNLFARRIGVDRRLVCVAPSYVERRGRPETPEDLASHELVQLTSDRDHEAWTFQLGDVRCVVPVRGGVRTDDVLLARSMALQGVGVAMLPESVVRADIDAGRLSTTLDEFEVAPNGVYVIHSYGSSTPPRVRAFITHIVDFVQRHGYDDEAGSGVVFGPF